MKLFLALASIVALASGKRVSNKKPKQIVPKDIKVNSELGNKIMNHARRVNEDVEIEFTWVANYSIKFQGCHSIQQWNEEADGEEDVRIQTKRLVRFRLCPTTDCTSINAGGCDSGYGEYIIDMNIFLDAYMEAVEAYNEWNCEYLEMYECNCDGDNNQDDNFDEDICLWDCYAKFGVEEVCMDENPYNNGNNNNQEEEEQFMLDEWVECAQWNPGDRRKLNQEEVQYFIGPFCAESGSAINLGLFTDESCTTFADEYEGKSLYKTLAGKELPYSEMSIIQMECIECKEPAENNNDGNDAEDEDEVKEMCEVIYADAGKCESSLSPDYAYFTPNENACNYMEGIKIVRKNGIITQSSSSKGNKTASIFIGIFVVAFVLLAAYVYYLKTKLDRASINLAE